MATDWIKMRTDLYRDPKVCLIADLLMSKDGDLGRYVNQNCQRDMSVTRNVMRNAVVGALVTVWGVARHRGKRRDDDLIISKATASVLDDMADLPGIGAALVEIGWAIELKNALILPRFYEEHNVEPDADRRQKNAERQRRFREKSNALRNAEVTPKSNDREEKRREESKDKDPPSPPGGNSGADPPAVTIPAELDTEAFRVAWGEWKRERTDRKTKAYTPRGELEQLKRLAQHGPAKSIEAIRMSIANGWQGVFPERIGNAGGNRNPGGDVRPRGRVSAPPGKYDHLSAGDPQAADPTQGSDLFGSPGNIAEPGGNLGPGAGGAAKAAER